MVHEFQDCVSCFMEPASTVYFLANHSVSYLDTLCADESFAGCSIYQHWTSWCKPLKYQTVILLLLWATSCSYHYVLTVVQLWGQWKFIDEYPPTKGRVKHLFDMTDWFSKSPMSIILSTSADNFSELNAMKWPICTSTCQNIEELTITKQWIFFIYLVIAWPWVCRSLGLVGLFLGLASANV